MFLHSENKGGRQLLVPLNVEMLFLETGRSGEGGGAEGASWGVRL